MVLVWWEGAGTFRYFGDRWGAKYVLSMTDDLCFSRGSGKLAFRKRVYQEDTDEALHSI